MSRLALVLPVPGILLWAAWRIGVEAARPGEAPGAQEVEFRLGAPKLLAIPGLESDRTGFLVTVHWAQRPSLASRILFGSPIQMVAEVVRLERGVERERFAPPSPVAALTYQGNDGRISLRPVQVTPAGLHLRVRVDRQKENTR